MTAKNEVASGRVWLNPSHPILSAFVAWQVDHSDKGYAEATLKIGDCDRVVSLDFTASHGDRGDESSSDPAVMLAKVDRLYREIARFRAAMHAEFGE